MINLLGYILKIEDGINIVFNGKIVHIAKDEDDAKRIMTEIVEHIKAGRGDRILSDLMTLIDGYMP